MRHKLVLKHIGGGRANVVDRFALPAHREITFGRDPACDVRYDEGDELVSRKHLKIIATDEQPVRYMVVDLGSRNGTFVNRQKVFGAALISPGVRVQLGPGGPEFEFSLEKGTKEAERSKAVRRTNHTRKRAFATAALMTVLLGAAGAAGYFAWSPAWAMLAPLWRDWPNAPAPYEGRSRFDGRTAAASVAGVEAEWNVFDKQTGIHVARAYLANERISQGARVPLVEGAPRMLPAFVVQEDRRIEPLLVPSGTEHAGQSVGGKWASKGLVVSEAGSVLAAGTRQRPWKAAYQWNTQDTAGALIVLESLKIRQVVPLAAPQFPRWVPAESGFFAERIPANLEGDLMGRHVSESDLRVAVTSLRVAAPIRSGLDLWEVPRMLSHGIPEPAAFSVSASLHTDAGCVRKVNEDYCQVIQPQDPDIRYRKGVLIVVADGVGGSQAGEVASRVAVETVIRAYYASASEPQAALAEAFHDANREIYHSASLRRELSGMGSTCTALVIHGREAHSAHVGDSRLYLVRSGSIYQMTEDHSVVGELIKLGVMTSEAARRHFDRNIILRALGSHATVDVATWERPLSVREDDCFVLCSDGLHDLVTDEEIRLSMESGNAAAACESLVRMARDRGGYDNITIVMARVEG